VLNKVLKVTISDSKTGKSSSKSVNIKLKSIVLKLDISTFGIDFFTLENPILDIRKLFLACL
jgi:hypothetical protein